MEHAGRYRAGRVADHARPEIRSEHRASAQIHAALPEVSRGLDGPRRVAKNPHCPDLGGLPTGFPSRRSYFRLLRSTYCGGLHFARSAVLRGSAAPHGRLGGVCGLVQRLHEGLAEGQALGNHGEDYGSVQQGI